FVIRQSTSLFYFPGKDFKGPDTLTYTISDVAGGTSTGTVFLVVKDINDAPTADNLTIATKRNSSVDIIFKGSDPDDDPLKFRVLSAPANGDLWNYPSIATYYPRKGFYGTDSFTYVANDGTQDSAVATVSITVSNVNNAPTINDQALLTKANRSVRITPSAQDIDEDPLTFILTTQPTNGTVLVQTNRLIYTPATNFLGSDQFFIQAFDGVAYSSEAKISISVISTNAPPIAREVRITVQPN